ncbi:hypothetical protein D3C80_2152310 [compost metagenome]
MGAMEMMQTWSTTPNRKEYTSFMLEPKPSLKMDSVSERRLKEWTSWEKLSTPKAKDWAWRRASSE